MKDPSKPTLASLRERGVNAGTEEQSDRNIFKKGRSKKEKGKEEMKIVGK